VRAAFGRAASATIRMVGRFAGGRIKSEVVMPSTLRTKCHPRIGDIPQHLSPARGTYGAYWHPQSTLVHALAEPEGKISHIRSRSSRFLASNSASVSTPC
jgi:hypothetical protein